MTLGPLVVALDGPLRALRDYPQFVTYGTEPMPGGKTKKFPCDPRTGRPCDGQDPANWMTADAALATGRPVGFVFTDDDPFFFLDIDGAYVDGAWSPLASRLYQRFAGCGYEVSQSGAGMHIIGSGTCPPHSSRNTPLGLELYTARRFVALTGTGASGDAGLDATAALAQTVAEYFPPTAPAERGEYEDGPRPEWRGPTDDDELIRRALRSTSAAAAFQGKATFADLWEGRAAANSESDAALASHLAFWTGCDGPRIEALMRRSALVRDKWERDDYLPRTIAKVCTPGRGVCQDREPAPAAVAADAQPGDPELPARGSILDGPAMSKLFDGYVYLEGQHRVVCPGGELLKPEAMAVRFGGYSFLMKESTDGAGAIKDNAFDAFTRSSRYVCARASQPVFDPTRTPGEVFEQEGRRLVNTYWPISIRRVQGDVQPFLDHLARLLPIERDRQILLSWMAAVVQHPGTKFLWSPVVVGGKGDGKSILFEKILTAAVGERYSDTVKPAQMNAKHGTWMLDKIFALCDDVGKFVTDEWLDDVKTIITGKRQMVEPKGVNMYMTRVCTNIAFTSNHRRNIRVTPDERRFAVLWCESPGAALTASFAGWTDNPANVAACSHLLATLSIPAEFNPYIVKNAPATSSMAQAVRGSSDAIDQVVEDAIEEGLPGFTGGLICMQDLERLLEHKAKRAVSRAVREEVLQRLGYVPHAHAGSKPDGWVNNPVKEAGNRRLRFFVKEGHPASQLPNGPAVAKHYIDTQTPVAAFGT